MTRAGRPAATPRLDRIDDASFARGVVKEACLAFERLERALRFRLASSPHLPPRPQDCDLGRSAWAIARFARTGAMDDFSDHEAVMVAVASLRDVMFEGPAKVDRPQHGHRQPTTDLEVVLMAAEARVSLSPSSSAEWIAIAPLATLASMSVRGLQLVIFERGGIATSTAPDRSVVVPKAPARGWLASRAVPGF